MVFKLVAFPFGSSAWGAEQARTPWLLVERALAAVRLTEGLTRKISHQSRYLKLLRHGAERRATSLTQGRLFLRDR
ncbi:MAG TPA: hypothetical protein DER43_05150 [Clostridiales bacterium]|nr:hypothetical protein [Clostridiales bacterium]